MGVSTSHNDADGQPMEERLRQIESQVRGLCSALDAVLARQPVAPPAPSAPSFASVTSPPVSLPASDADAVRRSRFGFASALQPPRSQSFAHGRARQVRQLIRRRRQRKRFFPADLFADPAWDMLLDLYAAHYEGRPVAVSSLCIAAAVPATTALRWIKQLTDRDFLMRTSDPDDGRRIFIHLSDEARKALDDYFDSLEEA